MKRAIRNTGVTTLVGASAALLLDAPRTFAQQAGEDRLDEIVVTARRRAEPFLDVPVTVTTFTEEEILAAGIERPHDFISLTPNTTLVETQNQGTSFVTIRGISQARNSEPSVAVIVDDVLMSNPAQFNQEMFDIQQIEVIRGAQGAIFGRNAIGGAIIITTKEPTEDFEGRLRLGYDSGPGFKAQLLGSGPLGGSETLEYNAAFSYFDTDGYIDNVYLGEKADPFKDVSGRARLKWQPSDRLTTDARIYYSDVDTQALYFNIDFNNDVNNTSLPVRVNNPGRNDRKLGQFSFKLDYELENMTFTSVTAYDTINEILTGDQFDFLPIEESLFFALFGDDWAQSQYLDVDTVSQDLRLTSSSDARFRWIAGLYYIATDRYISTGNIVDRGLGAFPVYRTPRGNFPFDDSIYPNSFQTTFLADSQDNAAWAVYGEITTDLSERVELSAALRYDSDTRKNTTETPQPFLAAIPGAFTGEVRKRTWDEAQPRLTLRYKPTDNVTLYGGLMRGFRSGGFNQTGVGADPIAQALGVTDTFDAEVADSIEVGVKSLLADQRMNLNFVVFDTNSKGPYFFVFLATSSTQNLGNLEKVNYRGFEFDVTANITDYLDMYFGYGYVDSEIKESVVPTDIGNQAPLVTRDTVNLSLQYVRPLGNSNLDFFLRGDYRRVGKTWWDPANTTVRNPVNLLDWRIGVEGETWSMIGWARNFNDVKYNAEFSPGGFLFKAQPRVWGLEFIKEF
jgi:iron complex outermembrane receptor protein